MNVKQEVNLKIESLIHSWNAFSRNDHLSGFDYGRSSSSAIHKTMYKTFHSSTIATPIYNRIAIDSSMTTLRHVKEDEVLKNVEVVKSGLNYCLNEEANIDQSHIQLIHDIVYSMFDEGVVAVVPVETSISPKESGGYEIKTLRTGRITNWFPKHVEVDLYNEQTGQNERIIIEKRTVAIIENPLYEVVNAPNSTIQRLINKISQLDKVDEMSSSGRIDLILSLPHAIKTDMQKKMAEDRIKGIQEQLALGKNGVVYIDGTEKATQLNRPINSQLMESVNKLEEEFRNQLGVTSNVMNGTANENELKTYYSRTIDPIIRTIIAELTRKFITKTARTQGHKIEYFRDIFATVSIEAITGLGDSFRRNSIASANEIRRVVGFPRSDDPRADELFNPNIADDRQKDVDPNEQEKQGMDRRKWKKHKPNPIYDEEKDIDKKVALGTATEEDLKKKRLRDIAAEKKK